MLFAQSERVLGAGSYGKVFLAERSDGALFALKRIEAEERDNASVGALREIVALHSLPKHPNLISAPCGFIRVGLHVYQPIELACAHALDICKQFTFTSKDALAITLAAGRGLAAMHEAGWLHRDVKLENILICADGSVKLCDFSLSTPMYGRGAHPQLTSYVCTLWVRPPELIYRELDHVTRGTYGPEIDVFSLGMCLLAMLRGKYHAKSTKKEAVFDTFLHLLGRNDDVDAYFSLDELQKETYPRRESAETRIAMTAQCSPDIASLLNSMLNPIPSKRVSLDVVLALLEEMLGKYDSGASLSKLVVPLVGSAASLAGIRQRLSFPTVTKSRYANTNAALQAYLYCASHGVPFHIAMMAVQACHFASPAASPHDICELARVLCSDQQDSKPRKLWDVASVPFDASVAKVCASLTLAPAQRCVFAAVLCKDTYTAAEIHHFVASPDALFPTAYMLWGNEIRKFGRRYKSLWGPQTSMLESWIRLEDESVTGASKDKETKVSKQEEIEIHL